MILFDPVVTGRRGVTFAFQIKMENLHKKITKMVENIH